MNTIEVCYNTTSNERKSVWKCNTNTHTHKDTIKIIELNRMAWNKLHCVCSQVEEDSLTGSAVHTKR